MAAVQINFTLRTSANVETVHLVGSWDSYRGQLPLSRDKSGKPGSWTGTFRFQQSMMHPGKRYWYYYVINGYHVSHDPAAEHTVEPTTGRKLNILDIPQNAALSRASARHSCRAPFNSTEDIIIGRGISPSRIVHPKPSRPYASRQLREDYEDDLSMRLNHSMDLSDSDSDISSSPPSSSGSSFSSRTGSTSPSSLSSLSDSSHSSSHCNCKRYGITRNGERVKLDCRGLVCGSGGLKLKTGDSGKTTPIETDSSCSSDSDEEYRRFAYNVKR
ncbi:hypothetical protein VTO42DRAFT_3651 [Malbranchea cinnamomea]